MYVGTIPRDNPLELLNGVKFMPETAKTTRYIQLDILLQLLCSKMPAFFTLHAQRERGKVIGRGVHIYVCSRKKYLNRTLEIDSPSQTLTVGLLVEFID